MFPTENSSRVVTVWPKIKLGIGNMQRTHETRYRQQGCEIAWATSPSGAPPASLPVPGPAPVSPHPRAPRKPGREFAMQAVSNSHRAATRFTHIVCDKWRELSLSLYTYVAMIFLGVCNARRATNLVTEVRDGGPCYAGLYRDKHFLTSSISSTM